MAKRNSTNGAATLAAIWNRLWPSKWVILEIVILALAAGSIFLFRNDLSWAILSTLGFGVILWLGWLGVIIFILWQRKWEILQTRWNVWLGALALTAAAWGILATIRPFGFEIGEHEHTVDFHVVSLGGEAGRYLIGSQGVGAPPALRIVLLLLAGVVFIAPGLSLKSVKLAGRATRASALGVYAAASVVLPKVGHSLAALYRRYPPQRLLVAPFAALGSLLRRRRKTELGAPEEAFTSEMEAEVMGPTPEAAAGRGRAAKGPAEVKEGKEAGRGRKEPARKFGVAEKGKLPPVDLLDKVGAETTFSEADNDERARRIEEALASYGVEAKVAQINPGPSVTQFGIEPGWERKYRRVMERDQNGKPKLDKDGKPIEKQEEVSKTRVKVERITALANNLALALASPSIRIEAPVPGKSLVGIEVPNTTTSVVRMRGVIESSAFQKVRAKSNLALALGKGSAGESVAADLGKMPHLLIAGETGSGKTVCISSIITCLLMQNQPSDLRLLLIDPKRVELTSFAGIPHLMSPVVVEMEKAIDVLRRVNREMDNRFNKFAAVGVRNVEGYNHSMLITEPMPYLVVVIDELAHLMMSAAEVVEPAICRLAQLSRATGIHLIVATQRPSVDVVTGLIKANFPTRIAFAVTSIVDSRTILDGAGAEKLLGRGDMLYLPPDAAKPKRLRGCFASDPEIDRVVKFWMQRQDLYPAPTEDTVVKAFASMQVDDTKGEDPLLATARRLAKDGAHMSTSLLQRRLHVGYPRAARIMDTLEQEGIVSRDEHASAPEAFEENGEEPPGDDSQSSEQGMQ